MGGEEEGLVLLRARDEESNRHVAADERKRGMTMLMVRWRRV